MKKAVIATGGKQYLVSEGQTLDVELLKKEPKSKVSFDALLVIDGEKTQVGRPNVASVKVNAVIVEESAPQDKVTSIRYKAKKRVRTVKGHRQKLSTIKVETIK